MCFLPAAIFLEESWVELLRRSCDELQVERVAARVIEKARFHCPVSLGLREQMPARFGTPPGSAAKYAQDAERKGDSFFGLQKTPFSTERVAGEPAER